MIIRTRNAISRVSAIFNRKFHGGLLSRPLARFAADIDLTKANYGIIIIIILIIMHFPFTHSQSRMQIFVDDSALMATCCDSDNLILRGFVD
jgi:hypothetical protein